MSNRRRAATLVAGILVIALGLGACGSGGDEEVDTSGKDAGAMADYGVGDQFTATEPLAFTILYSDHPNYPIKDNWLLWQELSERTNVSLEPTVVPMSDYDRKRSLLVGAGDAPLIIPKTYPGQETAFVSSGAVLAVSDYLDLMPNFQAKVKEWGLEDNLDTLRQEDGKFYVLPGLHEDPWQDYTIAMRTDMLDELGVATPTSWDEVRDALRAMKKAYPNSYPLSDRYSVGQPVPIPALLSSVAVGYGTSGGWSYQPVQWNADDATFELTGATDEYKAMVEYLHTLFAEGLLDPESITQDDDAAITKLVTGKSFAISANAQAIVNDYRTPLTQNDPSATIAKIPFPSGPAGNLISATTSLENGIMINADAAKSENFVAMMQFIDWLWYSDAGEEFAKWGVEGTTFSKDADGTRTLEPGVEYLTMNQGAPEHLQRDFGFSGGVFAYGGTTELLHSMFSQEELDFQALNADKERTELPPPHPLSDAEREQATLLETPLRDAVNQATIQFILGQRDLSEWDAYVAELESVGMGTYIDMVNGAHERYQSSQG